MNKTLTPAEKKIISRLKKRVKQTGCFGEMMQMAFVSNEPEMMRQLLADIKYQSYYAPDATAEMIGLKTFLMVIKLKS